MFESIKNDVIVVILWAMSMFPTTIVERKLFTIKNNK